MSIILRVVAPSVLLLSALGTACDQSKPRTDAIPAIEPVPSAKRTVMSCLVKADAVCSEYGERPELASTNCPTGGEVIPGPCPRDARVGTCTMLMVAGGSPHTVLRIHYAGGRADAEAQCKASSGTWAR